MRVLRAGTETPAGGLVLLLCGFLFLGVFRAGVLCGRFLCSGFFGAGGRFLAGRFAARFSLPAIVGYVPSGTFELNRGRGELLLDSAAAMGALFQVRPRDRLDFFRRAATLHAFVLVQRHCGFSSNSKEKGIISRASVPSGTPC